ncbi:MAG TPA: hypothetical protein VF247_01025 [Candidatus Krumholzibacteria bacterium]
MHRLPWFALILPLALAACNASAPGTPPGPIPPHSFAFAVFGDGPYRSWEVGRFKKMIEDVNATDLEFFIHVGDIFWFPCSDKHYRQSLAMLNTIEHPVVYTPGDNEWSDCGKIIAGKHDPQDRLRLLRATFFAHPGRTIGSCPMRVTSQAESPSFSEFVENVRFVRGGFVFITVHVLLTPPIAETDEVALRRGGAAIAWLDEAFEMARRDHLKGVVVAMQGDPGLDYHRHVPQSFMPFIARLEEQTRSFEGQVVLIHGDSHIQRFDQPLKDENGVPAPNFWRIEAFGSPQIGWVRVVVDSVAGRIVAVEPRKMSGWGPR